MIDGVQHLILPNERLVRNSCNDMNTTNNPFDLSVKIGVNVKHTINKTKIQSLYPE